MFKVGSIQNCTAGRVAGQAPPACTRHRQRVLLLTCRQVSNETTGRQKVNQVRSWQARHAPCQPWQAVKVRNRATKAEGTRGRQAEERSAKNRSRAERQADCNVPGRQQAG